jgi:hypothetical protein
VAVALAIVVVVVVVGLGYYFVVYVPEHNVVTMDGGGWLVNGASTSLGVSVGCSDCGQRPAPGSDFTIDVNVAISSESCGFFGCDGYEVNSFSVNAPYVLVQTAPDNLPVFDAAGSFNTWALTVQAPASAGHFPIGGVVGVSYS